MELWYIPVTKVYCLTENIINVETYAYLWSMKIYNRISPVREKRNQCTEKKVKTKTINKLINQSIFKP